MFKGLTRVLPVVGLAVVLLAAPTGASAQSDAKLYDACSIEHLDFRDVSIATRLESSADWIGDGYVDDGVGYGYCSNGYYSIQIDNAYASHRGCLDNLSVALSGILKLDGGYGHAETAVALYVAPGNGTVGSIESADGHYAQLGVNMTYEDDAAANRCGGPPTRRIYTSGSWTRPPFIVDPAIAGPPAKGETISIVRDAYWNTPADNLTYQWQRCASVTDGCSNVSGATARNYVATSADVGRYLRVRVTAAPQPPIGYARWRNSNQLGPIGETYVSDQAGPSLTLSGGLWDHRNQSSDHRNEGIYDAQSSLSAVATEPLAGSGVKSVEIWFINQLKAQSSLPCTLQCPAVLQANWTLDADSVADGTYPLKVVTRDLAGNAKEENWTVTVDRHGDVYQATQYDDPPAAGGEALIEEWAQLSTRLARSEEPTVIKTNNYRPCDDAQPSGPRCIEERTATRYASGGNLYTIYIGSREDDARIENVSDIFAYASLLSAEADARGPLAEAMEPWQRQPPGAGADYERHDLPVTETVGSDTPSEEDGPAEEVTLTAKVWIDAATRAPLKEIITDPTGAVVGQRFWTYQPSRKLTSEYLSDFFAVPRPSDVQQEKTVDLRAGSARGSVADTETSANFSGFWLGDTLGIATGDLCLAATHLARLNEFGQDSIGQGAPAFTSSTFGQLTLVGAAYNRLSSGELCVSNYGSLEAPEVEVHSVARSGTEAAGWRQDYVQAAQAIEDDPTDPDHDRAGLVELIVGGTAVTACVIPLGETELGALVEAGDTTFEVVGKFSIDDLTGPIQNGLEELQ